MWSNFLLFEKGLLEHYLIPRSLGFFICYNTAFIKVWSSDYLWSSRSALMILKKKRQKKKIKWAAYHTIAEIFRVWKWQMAIAFPFFCQYWDFMKFTTLPVYRLPTLHSAKKRDLKHYERGVSCHLFSAHLAPETTRIQNRGSKYRTFSCIYDILNSFHGAQSIHWNVRVLYRGAHVTLYPKF